MTVDQRTDLGNAMRFAAEHGQRLRYVAQRRKWIEWRDGLWREDVTGEANRAAKETVRRLWDEVPDLPQDEQMAAAKHALKSHSAHGIRAMMNLATTEPGIAVSVVDLDASPWLFTCGNGTIDLRTGELRPHDPADLITLGSDVPYLPTASCPRWLRFLDEVFEGDPEMVAFNQRLVGYSLTGDTSEHALFVFYGLGCNGKTVYVEMVKTLLGLLGRTASFDTFTSSRNDRGPRNDIARLNRARVVIASESGKGAALDEAVVKSLTGGDTVAARFLYGEHFEFVPEFKLWLVTNHRPHVDGGDEAIWRRLKLIPFNVSFLGREDRALSEKLREELPGILAWAVQGCLAWQRDGLAVPERVNAATSEYRADTDTFGAFIDACCVRDDAHARVRARDLRDAADNYYKENGETPPTASEIGQRLRTRGINKVKVRGAVVYVGLRLREGVGGGVLTPDPVTPLTRTGRERFTQTPPPHLTPHPNDHLDLLANPSHGQRP